MASALRPGPTPEPPSGTAVAAWAHGDLYALCESLPHRLCRVRDWRALALWQANILAHVDPIWVAIGLIVAIGVGIMFAVSAGKPTVTSE